MSENNRDDYRRVRISPEHWNIIWNELPPVDRLLPQNITETKEGWQCLALDCIQTIFICDQKVTELSESDIQSVIIEIRRIRRRNFNSMDTLREIVLRIRSSILESKVGIYKAKWDDPPSRLGTLQMAYGSAWFGAEHPTHIVGCTEMVRRFLYDSADRMLKNSRRMSSKQIHVVCGVGFGPVLHGEPLFCMDDLPDGEMLLANPKMSDDVRLSSLVVFTDIADLGVSSEENESGAS